MGGDHPSERRRDDAVGSGGAEAAGGGGHTPEQASITDMGSGGQEVGGREERRQRWGKAGEAGRSPPVPGGASAGHSDRESSHDGDETVVSGHSKSEREAG